MTVEIPAAACATGAQQTKRLRIAVLTRNFSPTAGGAERYAIAMVEQLAARHDIKVFAQVVEHSRPGVKYQRISAPFKRPRWLNQLWFAGATWWATRHGFDIVHSHENTWHGNVQTVHVLPVRHNIFKGRAGLSKLKQALTWLSVLTSPRLMCYLTLEYFRYAPKPGRRVVATSQMLRDVFIDCFPAAKTMTAVVTPGIEMPGIAASPQAQSEARHQLGLPQSGPCLLFVGNDFKKKGLQTLLQALGQLPGTTVLAVVGASKHKESFEQQVMSAGLSHRVFFLGSMRNTEQAYLAATCLVHPTREDTFAMVVLEAMAFGLPVIVSNAAYCGVAAMLTHQTNALLLLNPLDAAELATTITAVLDDDLLRSNLGNQARSFAKNFDWHYLARQQESIYFEVAGLAAKPR